MKNQIYVSTDIEADGPIPGEYSMLSFASAAYVLDNSEPVATFTANLHTLPDAKQDPKTMQWWSTQGTAWDAHRMNLEDPAAAMVRYRQWLDGIEGLKIFAAYPVSFDQGFVHWYMVKFTGEDPFGFSGFDLKSYAMGRLGTDFKKTAKRRFPSEWFPAGKPHTHIALDDALEQGAIMQNMINWKRDPVWLSFYLGQPANMEIWQQIQHSGITIRKGWRNIHAGDILILGCPIAGVCTQVKAHKVDHIRLNQLSNEDRDSLGFSSRTALMQDMRAHYGEMHTQSQITVIKWVPPD